MFQLVFSNCIDKECAEDGQLKDLRWSLGKAIVLFHYLRHYIHTQSLSTGRIMMGCWHTN